MKRPLLAAFVLSAVAVATCSSTYAQSTGASTGADPNSKAALDQNIDLLRKDIRSQKKQLIAANVPLTDTEAQAFWPVYDQYTADLVKIHNDRYELIKEYAQSYSTMTDAQADDWTKRVLKMDADVAALRAKYQPMFRKILPAKKCALYEQVERQAQMMIDTQLNMQIPLVQP
jgi:outer membrane murein-binding lipoprotein Lpp